MRKLLLVLITTALLISGCGTKVQKAELPIFSEQQEVYYEKYTYAVWDTKGRKRVTNENQEYVNSICYNVNAFLNKKYNANWNAPSIDCYLANVTNYFAKITEEFRLGALYYNGDIYIDEIFYNSATDIQREYVISHELIHYLFDANTGKEREFCLTKNGGRVGIYLEEAIVDQLAINFIKNEYPKITKEEVTSGYKYIRMYVNALELGIPDFYSYFFKGDMNGMEKDFKKHAEEHVKCIGNSFEKWMKLLDMTLFSENEQELSECLSIVLSFTAAITPKSEAQEFLTRVRDLVNIGDNSTELMY